MLGYYYGRCLLLSVGEHKQVDYKHGVVMEQWILQERNQKYQTTISYLNQILKYSSFKLNLLTYCLSTNA